MIFIACRCTTGLDTNTSKEQKSLSLLLFNTENMLLTREGFVVVFFKVKMMHCFCVHKYWRSMKDILLWITLFDKIIYDKHVGHKR